MYMCATIKLRTNFLGSGPRQAGRRTLKRTPDNRISIDENEWRSDLSEAAKSLGIEANMKCIKFEEGFYAEKTCTLRRTYNKVNVEMFEGIPAPSILDIYMFMDERVGEDMTLDNLKKSLTVFGKFFGISQFGKKFQCGRFDVLELKVLNKDDYK